MAGLPPGSTIGILGSGQLGRMLALAAARLGLKCHVYSDASGPAFDVAAAHTIGAYDDLEKITAFARTVDVVTYEFENVPLAAAAAAEIVVPVRPGKKALAVAQDRLEEKRFVTSLGLPVAPFASVASEAELAQTMKIIGVPSILKTRRLGYDGKGQARIMRREDAPGALGTIARTPAVLEGFVSFEYEVSVLAVRAIDGTVVTYDIPLNTHTNGILHTSTVPSPLPPRHAERAREVAATIVAGLDYVGVIGVEMFYLGETAAEAIVVNEFAPRVHNSGHWTMDACAVDQFENHIRAVAGWPLGATGRHSDVVMTNLIGRDADAWGRLAAEPGACLHLYGKRDARPGRKMGHVNRITTRSGR